MSDYPKAKYKKAVEGQGDQNGQFNGGRHPYVSALVLSAEEEKALGWEWVDHPNEVAVKPPQLIREETTEEEKSREAAEEKEEKDEDIQPKAVHEVRRGPGRPPRIKSEE